MAENKLSSSVSTNNVWTEVWYSPIDKSPSFYDGGFGYDWSPSVGDANIVWNSGPITTNGSKYFWYGQTNFIV